MNCKVEVTKETGIVLYVVGATGSEHIELEKKNGGFIDVLVGYELRKLQRKVQELSENLKTAEDAYKNMRDFATSKGLDVTTTGEQGVCGSFKPLDCTLSAEGDCRHCNRQNPM